MPAAAADPFARYLTLGDLLDAADAGGGSRTAAAEHHDADFRIRAYPETLLICGSGDPLVKANRKVARLLGERGVVACRSCRLEEFPGPHAFHGIPPQWTLDGWRSNSYPTTREMIQFLTGGEVQLPDDTIFQPHDWSLPLVLTAHAVIPLLLAWQTMALFF